MASDPNAVAAAFLDAYQKFAAAGDANGLASLYGDASVAIYDGNVTKGAKDIANVLINGRVAGGLKIRFSSTDAHFVPTGQLLIMATGDCDKPAGRFSQIFVLNALPNGSMFIKTDICRFGVGATAQQLSMDPSGMGAGFVNQYYSQYHSNKASLVGVFGPKSQLSFEGGLFQGFDAISQKLPNLPSGKHDIQSLDTCTVLEAPTAPGAPGPAVVALVTGNFLLEGEKNPLMFCEAFVLVVEGPNTYCANSLFRFNYA